MEETLGILKVHVIRGNRLAVRDFTSSDPYVIIKFGNQTSKTEVVNSCLNPIWNHECTFTVAEPVGSLKLEVFDRDFLKYDDKMGHAFLDIQPILSASRLKRALNLEAGETKLRKVVPAADNCLMDDSFIICMNGEITQDVRLRLRDVETGELIVKVKFIETL